MKRIPIATAFIACAGLLALGQVHQPVSETAPLSELQGVTNVFVNPTLSSALNKTITATIQKKLPHLRFVSTIAEADVWLWVTVERKYQLSRAPANPNDPGSIARESADLVFVVNAQILRITPDRPFRLIKKFRRQGSDEKSLAKSSAEDFVETYNQANAGLAPTKTKTSHRPAEPVSEPPRSTPLDSTTIVTKVLAPDDVEVLRVDTNLVTINVSVLDRENRYVSTLSRDAFSLEDGGIKQQLSYFATVDEPFTVALLIDTSRSVKFKLPDIMAAANAFVSQLRPDDKLMVVTFDTEIKEIVKTGRIGDVIKQGFSVTPGTGQHTFVFDAVAFTINERLSVLPGRKAIVLLTDGIGDERTAGRKTNIRDAEESGTLIYPIQFDTYADAPKQFTGPAAGKMVAAYLRMYEEGTSYLKELAQKSGGRFHGANEVEDFSHAFAAIVKELSNQYSLGYYPRPLPKIGERRDVKVAVGLPNVAVRGRKRYIFRRR